MRIGVVGLGQLARTAHLPLLSRMPAVTVSAICDSDSEALRRSSLLAPDAVAFNRFSDLLDSHSVDAVVISLPSHLHADAAVAAFGAGVHVYLEKPIASKIPDARRILNSWIESGKVGMIGHNYRFHPLVTKLRRQIRAGVIGRPTSAHTRFATPAPRRDSWRSTRESGGGALLDLAVHHVDLLRFLLDTEIASASARIESRQTEHDAATLRLTTVSGVSADVDVAFGESFKDRLEVRGETGTLWIDLAHSVDVGTGRFDGRIGLTSRISAYLPTPRRVLYFASRHRSPSHEPSFELALSAFVEAAASGEGRKPDLHDGFAALAVIDAAERSALSGQPVSVGEWKGAGPASPRVE
ncbi:MAG: Gfo/Idh/MocA family oxidoreductase [Gemmatimonadales bacterium]